MPNYRDLETNYIEEMSVDIFRQLGINANRNNLKDKTAVDLIVLDNFRVDVQYSQDFLKWGDLRLDFVSAYSKKNEKKLSHKNEIFNKFETKYGYKIDKIGKYFQENYLDAVIILFYNDKLNINNEKKHYPDKVMIIKKDDILNYLDKNTDKCFSKLKLNNKDGLGDIHGSAFLPINAEDVKKETNCFFDTISELIKQSNDVKKYLR